MMNSPISSLKWRRLALWALVSMAGFSVGGCAWLDENVVEKVKNINRRTLTVITDPPGGDLFVNDVFQGKTPVSITYKAGVKDMWSGFVVVVQKKGYLPIRRKVSYQKISLNFRLIRIRRGKRRSGFRPPGPR
ncbi:MAG: PEGA domain-containing protein [Nitrospinota bacterium]